MVTLDSYSLDNAHQYFPFVRTHAKIWKSPEYTFDLIKNYYVSKDNYELIRFYQTNGFEKNDSQIRISKLQNLPQDFPIKITEMDSQRQHIMFEKIVDLCNQKGSMGMLLTMPGMKKIILKEGVNLDYASFAVKYALRIY